MSTDVLLPIIFSALALSPAPICLDTIGEAPIQTSAAKAEIAIIMGLHTPRPVSASAPITSI